MTQKKECIIRFVKNEDFLAWKPLWEGYAAFYGRAGKTALPEIVTTTLWKRFLDTTEPVFALVAETEGKLCGLAHYVIHRRTFSTHNICYLEDLFINETCRGSGIGRTLINAVYEQARKQGIETVYWQTQESNAAARKLYDKVAQHEGFIVYSHSV